MTTQSKVWDACEALSKQFDGKDVALRSWRRTAIVSSMTPQGEGQMFLIQDPRDHGKVAIAVKRTEIILAVSLRTDSELGDAYTRRLLRFLRRARPTEVAV